MAALANAKANANALANTSDRYIEFDVNHIIDCKTFIETCRTLHGTLYDDSHDNIVYMNYDIILRIEGIEYHCTVMIEDIPSPTSFIILFFNMSHPLPYMPGDSSIRGLTFLRLHVHNHIGMPDGLTTNIKFTPIPGYKPFESIIYIKCMFYRMIGVEQYKMIDSVTFTCDKKNNTKKNKYNGFFYRLFATEDGIPKYEIKELSIYYKFFNYRIYLTDLNQLVELDTYSSDEDSLHYYLQECADTFHNYQYEFTKGDPQSIATYFAPFTQKMDECSTYAALQTKIHKEMQKNEDYAAFEGIMTYFMVHNTDCIYYPKGSPKKGSPKKGSPKKGSPPKIVLLSRIPSPNESLPVQSFNIEQDHFSYSEFVEKCKTSSKVRQDSTLYCILLTTNQGVSYHCVVYTMVDRLAVYILGTDKPYHGAFKEIADPLSATNKYTFLYLYINNKNNTATSSITTRIPFKRLHNNDTLLTPLETIIYIRCFFYRMVSVTRYTIVDEAHGMCTTNDSVYLLLIYRLFRKTSVINKAFVQSLSIYYKYFTTKYNNNMKVIDYTDSTLLENIKKIRELTFDFGKGPESIVDHFAEFTRDSDRCSAYAEEIEKVHNTLYSANEVYGRTIDLLSSFIVTPEDCIYYVPLRKGRSPNRSATRRGMRSPNRSATRRGMRSPNRSATRRGRSPTRRSPTKSANKP